MSLVATPDGILDACRTEVRLRDELPRVETGQMADSYDTLHGVRFINLIVLTTPADMPFEPRLYYHLYLFDAFIVQSLQELIQRASEAITRGALAIGLEHLDWIDRLLRLMHDANGLIPSVAMEQGRIGESPSTARIMPMIDALCDAIRGQLIPSPALASRPENAEEALRAKLFHQAKTMILQLRETLLLNRRQRPPEIDPRLEAAHLQCVAAAAAGLRLEKQTYINQFCLLHQLPELLTPLVLDSFLRTEQALNTDDQTAAIGPARMAGDLMFLITLTLWPLIDRLDPAAYYAFRENLGATSGSSSAAIRGKLLTTAYTRLARAFIDHETRVGHRTGESDLFREVARIRTLIYRWRGLHMALPRNVLGSNGTKSLMGSPDALKAADAMAVSFAAKDPLSARLSVVSDMVFPADSPTAKLDAWLLQVTGEAAQARFRQVQERTGAWTRVQRA
jgi:hypothetical protein